MLRASRRVTEQGCRVAWRSLGTCRPPERFVATAEGDGLEGPGQREVKKERRDGAEPHPEAQASHPALQRLLRVGHAAEVATVKFFEGQSWATGSRIDVQYFLDQEQLQLKSVQDLAESHRVRPSPLLPVLGVGGWALGVATAVVHRRVSLAVAGAVQDSLSQEFNDQIRELRGENILEKTEGLREALRGLRDTPRAPQGAPPPPDLSMLNKVEDLSAEAAVGAAVKALCRASMNIVGKL
eukprot:evm.model.scf_151.6 EVM.evm.TU.scf_151.6   scf_151:50806-53639(-)